MENCITNINEYFSDLRFEEDKHIYYLTVDSEKLLPSVSGLIKKYCTPFDAEEKAKAKSERTGIPFQDYLDEWENEKQIACDTGHRVHLFGEHYVYDRTLVPTCGQELAVVNFWNSLPEHIVPVVLELRMYHKILKFAGTSDILLYDTIKKGFIIADYKTNKDLFKNFQDQALLPPFSHLLDSPFNKYQIQLSFYQILFEQLGYKVISRKIIWLLKTGEFLLYDTEDLTKTLLKDLS